MHSRDYWNRAGCDHLSAALGDAKVAAEESLRGGRSKRDDHLGLDHLHFLIEPWAARGNLHSVRLLMDSAFAARFPFEMLYGISYIDIIAVDACSREGFVEDFSGRPYKRSSLQIFVIARLLANHHHFRARFSFPENGLCAALPKIAAAA